MPKIFQRPRPASTRAEVEHVQVIGVVAVAQRAWCITIPMSEAPFVRSIIQISAQHGYEQHVWPTDAFTRVLPTLCSFSKFLLGDEIKCVIHARRELLHIPNKEVPHLVFSTLFTRSFFELDALWYRRKQVSHFH